MNPIVKNLVSAIRRFKLATTLNVLGLSVAFAAFMVIMIQLNYDFGFDRFHKDYDKIFRLEVSQREQTQAVINRPLAELFFESSPHIIAGALVNPWSSEYFFYVENDGIRNYFREQGIMVTPEFTDVFTFDFVEGNSDVLKTPENVLISLSLSRKLFGNEQAVGKQILFSNGFATIGAVYRDFPKNSIIENHIYGAINEHENKNNWENWNYVVYLRVNEASSAEFLFENFKRNFDAKAFFGENFDWDESGIGVRLTSLPDIHFITDVRFDNTPKASKQTLMILFAIGIVIIIIAGINFTNFSTALAPMRIKNVNTQRVFGAQLNVIRFAIVFEAIFFSVLSYLVALFLIILFKISPLIQLIDADLSFGSQLMIFVGTALVALLVGFIAGIYPSLYMTSFEPALVLKGSFGLSPKGRQLRNMLIGIQFVASFALIVGASFMYLQNHFMQNSPLGYHKDELIVTNIGRIQEHRDVFANKIRSFAGVEDLTFGESLLSSSDQYMGWGRNYREEQISFQILPVHYTFLDVMGVKITEGRGFRSQDADTQNGAYVFNEIARRRYNMELGTSIDNGGEIVGFMDNVKFASFRIETVPMAFYVWGTQNWGRQPNQAYIKLAAGANLRTSMEHIKATIAELTPEYHTFIDVQFFDQVLQNLYEKERATSSLITLFSLLAIFISIVGVFGLVVFDSQYRRKEIGVRKIHGATTMSIIVMFNKAYIKILLICFVIASPLAWYVVNGWLQNFGYKTPMHWWVYLMAFMAVATVTICTVTFQNWKVASDDPVKSIKSE
jgi:putative ABC transport system permease protein